MPVTLKSRIPGFIAAVRANLTEVVEESLREMADVARERVPVKTGALRDSISILKAGDLSGSVEADAGHAIYVELGTVHEPAQPFLTPPALETQDKLPARIADAVQRALP